MFWIPFDSNKDRGLHIDLTSEKGQQIPAIRFIG